MTCSFLKSCEKNRQDGLSDGKMGSGKTKDSDVQESATRYWTRVCGPTLEWTLCEKAGHSLTGSAQSTEGAHMGFKSQRWVTSHPHFLQKPGGSWQIGQLMRDLRFCLLDLASCPTGWLQASLNFFIFDMGWLLSCWNLPARHALEPSEYSGAQIFTKYKTSWYHCFDTCHHYHLLYFFTVYPFEEYSQLWSHFILTSVKKKREVKERWELFWSPFYRCTDRIPQRSDFPEGHQLRWAGGHGFWVAAQCLLLQGLKFQ